MINKEEKEFIIELGERRQKALADQDSLDPHAFEKKQLEEFYANKDGALAKELAQARKGIIDAAYDSLHVAHEKVEVLAEGNTLPEVIWLTAIKDGKQLVGAMGMTEQVAAYATLVSAEENLPLQEVIMMHPDLLPSLTPREIGAVYAHEAGHDIIISKAKAASAEVPLIPGECAADHVAQVAGYGPELISALDKMKITMPWTAVGGIDHPSTADRIAALQDVSRLGLPIGSITFDNNCNIITGDSLKPDSTPSATSSPAQKQEAYKR